MHYKTKLKIWGCLFSCICFPMIGFSMETSYKISQFVSPETCGDCHTAIYGQWKNSMHNLSEKDPVYVVLAEYLLKGLTHKDELKEGESCVKCHVPVGVVTGYPGKTSDDKSKIPPLAMKGIQCDYCHSVTGAEKNYNNGLLLSPGNGEDDPGVKRGPFKDSESDYHESMYSEFHTDSKICGTCHNVKHVVYKTDLETTYDEWEKGPYNSGDPEKKISCQGCHMYQRPGIPATGSTERPANKGRASDDGPMRNHIFTHYFVGANQFVPENAGSKEKAAMAEARLKHAATLEIDGNAAAKGNINISVKNTGAGHKLPTGLTDLRQMWLEITIRDENQNTIFSTGVTDKDGYLKNDAIIYNTVFGDGKGNVVSNISKAKEILKDKRIEPLAASIEPITFKTGKAKKLAVKARLLYRSAPQQTIDAVVGKGKMVLPVTVMAEASKVIEL